MAPRRAAVALAAIALALAGCTRDDADAIESGTSVPSTASIASSTTPGSTVPDSTIPESTAPATSSTTTTTTTTTTTVAPTSSTTTPTTTAAPTTPAPTAAPTTTIAPLTAADLVLRNDGVGPIAFGTGDTAAIGRLGDVLGSAVSDDATAYPVPVAGGYATDASGEEVFAHQYGRATCFGNGLCVFAGGASPTAMRFVGWGYAGELTPVLHTPSGVTVGSRWADFPTMSVQTGGCFSEGYGSVDGVDLAIHSEGVPFGDIDDAGNYVAGRPDPADAFVTDLTAGDLPAFPAIDC